MKYRPNACPRCGSPNTHPDKACGHCNAPLKWELEWTCTIAENVPLVRCEKHASGICESTSCQHRLSHMRDNTCGTRCEEVTDDQG